MLIEILGHNVCSVLTSPQVGRGCAFAPCTLLPTRADHVFSAMLTCSKIRHQNPAANIKTLTVFIRE